jgi:CTP:molybdopterin cytidylyltransferase MocA
VGKSRTRVQFVFNPHAARGLGTSVRSAVGQAPAGLGLLFGHADMPLLRRATVRRIAMLGATLRHAIVQPTVAGQPVNPVWFPAALRAELARVPDRTGGKPVMDAHPELVVHLAMDAQAHEFVDVDVRRDLGRLRAVRGGRRARS